MEQVGREGRTVLFVSHNMGVIEQLCSKCMYLEKGTLKLYSDDVKFIINEYLFKQGNEPQSWEWTNSGCEYENPVFKPLAFYFSDARGNKLSMPVSNDRDIWVNLDLEIKECDPLSLIHI